MANLNLAGFKKTREDKKTVTMGHPSGHSITILKSKLPTIQRKQLERIPLHLAEGDPSVGSDEQPVPNPNPSVMPSDPNSPEIQSDMVPIEAPAPGAPQTPVAESAQDQSSSDKDSLPAPDSNLPGAGQPVGGEVGPKNQTTPISVAGSPIDLNASYRQGQKAIGEQADVSAQLAKAHADIQQKDIDDRQALNQAFQDNTKQFQAHQQQLLDDYKNNHIDPNHFQENMGTGQKVATAIGLLLGGFTGGFNKTGVNPAADWLNGQITRDIEAQRSRLDQQKTLLGANQELYHDQLLANNATRINMNDIYGHQIDLAASKLGTPQAQAAADAAKSKLAFDSNKALQENAVRATALQAVQRSGGAGLSPLTLGQAGLIPLPEAQKEQESITRQKTAINNLNTLYSEANKEQTATNLLNPASYSRINNINAGIRDAILSTDVGKRISPQNEKEFLEPYLISTRDTLQGTAGFKQQAALNKVKEFSAGQTPYTERIAPAALPQYGTQDTAKPQYKVGQIVYVGGQKGQVLQNGQVKAVN